ncbi:aldo/keto reductase [Nocardioides terrisoli]|uniref:aldo/keto reductase n=1 Tax=Nocardioides terrisoli TaxID=3388267 RepID=UPI00287B81B7|nr:aldo/keto reductase [Nocardioides marmorisolisilvae]
MTINALAGEVAIGDQTVRRFGFGAFKLTGPGGLGEPADRSYATSVVRSAVDAGINFVDTADTYGPYMNEVLLADALHPYPDDLVIATKGGRTRDSKGNWGCDGRPEHLRAACEGSLRRLRVDSIDLYQLHWVDPAVPFEDSLGALADLRRSGKIRNIGLSNISCSQLEEALALTPIASVQNRFNLIDRVDEPLVEMCAERQIAFIPWYPVMQGKLADLPHVIGRVARSQSATVAQVALAWLLQRSPVVLPIPGTSQLEHLDENIEATRLVLSDSDLAALDEEL